MDARSTCRIDERSKGFGVLIKQGILMIGGALIKDAVLVRGEAAAVKEDNDVVLDPCEGSGRS